jgi:hypothetical protein
MGTVPGGFVRGSKSLPPAGYVTVKGTPVSEWSGLIANSNTFPASRTKSDVPAALMVSCSIDEEKMLAATLVAAPVVVSYR